MTLVTLLLGGCVASGSGQGGDTPGGQGQLVITARDFAFTLQGHVRPGPTRVVLDNQGDEPHQATLLRLRGRATGQQLLDAFARDPSAHEAMQLVTAIGGPNAVLPGERQRVVVDLRPGTYVVMCFVRSPDGHDHVSKGMVTTFAVRGSARRAEARRRRNGDIVLREMAFALPPRMVEGRGRFRVVNQGIQIHELALLKLVPGRALGDLQAYLAALGAGSPPRGVSPFLEAGGVTALGPGRAADIELELDPGSYAAVCLVPDPARGGTPHLAEGMVAYFTVV